MISIGSSSLKGLRGARRKRDIPAVSPVEHLWTSLRPPMRLVSLCKLRSHCNDSVQAWQCIFRDIDTDWSRQSTSRQKPFGFGSIHTELSFDTL